MESMEAIVSRTGAKGRWVSFLPIAGALYLTGVLIRGPFATPSIGADRFAARASSPAYGAAYVLITAAAALSILGFVSLRERLGGRLGTAAFAFATVGLVFLVPLFGVSGVAFPALGHAYAAGAGPVMAAAKTAANGRVAMIFFGLASLGSIGHGLFAVASWRRRGAWRVAAIPFGVAPILMCIPFVYALEIAGCALFLVAGTMLARAASDP
jgi:hypothetical protein